VVGRRPRRAPWHRYFGRPVKPTAIIHSLILAAAASAGCSTVLSEDLNPGQVILGVKVHNPFVG